ncbi:MAG: hypothetical protein IIA07_06090 [Proteobacteria bacterium]|nr:hypothetical protein [Pseudomonadota bacterium]
MAKLRKLTLLALVLGFMGTATADTLDVAPDENAARPTRGMKQDVVESKFGIPQSRDAAIGDPPISRWEYRDFVVFFEYDRVIHAVIKR